MDILNYSSPTPLSTSARHYLGLVAIATAGLSAGLLVCQLRFTRSWSVCFAARLAASSALLRSLCVESHKYKLLILALS